MQQCIFCGKEVKCDCGGGSKHGEAVLPCQVHRGALWVHVCDEESKNIVDFPVSVSCEGPVTTPVKTGVKTDFHGVATFDPLDSKLYTVTLGELPPAIAKTHLLPEFEKRTRPVTIMDGEIAYAPFLLRRAPGTLVVEVVDADGGKVIPDTVFSIRIAGIDELNPTDRSGVLQLTLPPKAYEPISVVTEGSEMEYMFKAGEAGKATVVSGEEAKVTLKVDVRKVLRLQIFDMHIPRANQDYKLVIHEQPGEIVDKTNSDGVLQALIQPKATEGELTIGPDQQTIRLKFKPLEPLPALAGVQKRLQQLGYETGESTTTMTPALTAAILRFQREHAMSKPTGEAGEWTAEKLKEVHDVLFAYPV